MILYFIIFFSSLSLYAVPGELEVWLLSTPATAHLHKLLDEPPFTYQSKTARLVCQEMGDFCFDPQFGLYKKNDSFEEKVDVSVIDKNAPTIPHAQSLDRELITCDKNNYFDIFCGKAKGQSKPESSLSIWLDTSSSLKDFDYPDKDGGCFRKSFLRKLDEQCGFNKKMNVMIFDTAIKEASSLDDVCHHRGLNNYKRLMDWIERSEVKKLVVITDIYELHKDFSDYIKSINGTFRGDKEPLRASDLIDLADDLAKICK